MKRITRSLLPLSVVLLICCAMACLAIEYPKPSGNARFPMLQGWYQGKPAWFVGFSTSDPTTAYDFRIYLVPKLASITTVTGGAAKMYVSYNGDTFAPVFSTAPGEPDYSGIWDAQLVVWLPGVTPWIITRTDIVGVPPGLPDATQADIIETHVIFDLPIMAIGPLGGPWYPAPPGGYRIKQGRIAPGDLPRKLITLPTFDVFCQDDVHKRVSTNPTFITDASDPVLANVLGANLAPALANADAANTQIFWFILGGPYNCQKPVIEFCPFVNGRVNPGSGFTPVMEFVFLTRSGSLPPWTVVNNPGYLQYLIGIGLLTPLVDDTYINAHPLIPLPQ